MIPPANQITPPPNQFTHRITQQQSYYYVGPQQGSPPEGQFNGGELVVLMVYDGGGYCRVVDERGLYVATQYDGLERITLL